MQKKKLIYIVEDEQEIADIVAKYLEIEGFLVKAFYRGDTGLAEIKKQPPDLAILDIMLPGIDGVEILRELRKKHFFPVIFLTCRKDEVDRILGLEMGADDYVPKPFSPRELVAKVRSLFRRIEYTRTTIIEEKSKDRIESRFLTLDLSRRKLICGENSTDLTPTEFSLMELLMRNPGKIYVRDELLEYIWGSDFAGSTRTLDVHMGNLRQKIAKIAGTMDFIRGVRGVGYAFED